MRSALALAVANVLAGLLNYLFQVHGAAVLDATAFGLLSAWLAEVTLLSAVTTVVQFVSLDAPLATARFKGLLRASGAASLVLLVLAVAFGSQASNLVLGASTFVSAAVLYAVVGQLQARLRLADAAAAFLATAGFRFALPFAWAPAERAKWFYVAHGSSAFAGVVVAVALVTLRSRAASPLEPVAAASASPSPTPSAPTRLRLARPLLLAFATVAFPLVDVLAVSTTQAPATTGAFSRIALAARIVFFGGAAILQILLPHRLHAEKTGDALPPFVTLIERWATPALLGGAVALAAFLDVALLHPQGAERIWLFATCLEAAALVAILAHVQRLAASGHLRRALACVLGVVAASGLAAGVATLAALGGAGPASVSRYALGALAGDVLVLLLARTRQLDSPPPEPGVPSRP